jgi:hypothetical protein
VLYPTGTPTGKQLVRTGKLVKKRNKLHAECSEAYPVLCPTATHTGKQLVRTVKLVKKETSCKLSALRPTPCSVQPVHRQTTGAYRQTCQKGIGCKLSALRSIPCSVQPVHLPANSWCVPANLSSKKQAAGSRTTRRHISEMVHSCYSHAALSYLNLVGRPTI